MQEFVERDYGAASGLTAHTLEVAFPDGNVPGLEDRPSVQTRSVQGLRELVRDHEGKKILVVAHGGVINAILATLSNGEIGSGKTTLHNACISVIRFHRDWVGRDGWRIESYNAISHLGDLCSPGE